MNPHTLLARTEIAKTEIRPYPCRRSEDPVGAHTETESRTKMELLDFDFEKRIERAGTLPARRYTRPAYLSLEQRRIFNRSWQLVGRLEQAASPGEFFTTDIGEEPIVIVRGQDGVLRGFHNVCRH